jgi:hypothetical protein
MLDQFSKAVIEYAGRGKHIYSCDICSRVTTEATPIFTGPRGEKIDLCGECIATGFKSVNRRPSRTEVR